MVAVCLSLTSLCAITDAWKGGFAKTMQNVLSYLSDASDSTLVWLDILAVNQHGGPEGSIESRAQNKADVGSFKGVLKVAEAGTIVVLDVIDEKTSPAFRSWCL